MIEVAALRSGQDVRYIEAPMPPSYDGIDDTYARLYKSGHFNHLASFVGFDSTVDYSRFWHEYDKLQKE